VTWFSSRAGQYSEGDKMCGGREEQVCPGQGVARLRGSGHQVQAQQLHAPRDGADSLHSWAALQAG
jgi:hypothetical protein